jgi:hypothetical protein
MPLPLSVSTCSATIAMPSASATGGRRLRVAGPAVPVPVSDRPRHYRHALERLDVLRDGQPPEARMTKVVRKLRCAVYTRKSSEEGLEQEFNSLHAQREACEAYITSQKPEG